MKETLVMTLIGKDRPGLVEALSALIEEHGGNWEEGRMVQLAGEFAGLLRAAVPQESAADLEHALGELEGVSVLVARSSVEADTGAGTRLLSLELVGQDHSGIVHRVSESLAAQGINVEELETRLEDAPMSGEMLFRARARLRAPAEIGLGDLQRELERLAGDLMVDIRLHEPEGG